MTKNRASRNQSQLLSSNLNNQDPYLKRRLIFILAVIGVTALAFFLLWPKGPSDSEKAVKSFLSGWVKGNDKAMYSALSAESKANNSEAELTELIQSAEYTATVTSKKVIKTEQISDNEFTARVRINTKIFGALTLTYRLNTEGKDRSVGVKWLPELRFPELQHGEQLTRETELPARADLLTRDKQVLASGEGRSGAFSPAAADIVGQLGPIPDDQKDAYDEAGFPTDAQVGITGLERIFNNRLAGKPGGKLFAGSREIAASEPEPARSLRTSISPAVQEAAVAALAGRYGGVAAVDPSTGEVLALAGIASSAPQPPGSVFKVVTAVAGLEAGVIDQNSSFPAQQAAVLDGVELGNAHDELCGGTLKQAFAESCNSVFAPIGVKVGAKRLVATAEKLGFNRPAPWPGAASSTLPPAEEISGELAVGSTAIGQGMVLATPLTMASITSAVANNGSQPKLTLEAKPSVETTQTVTKSAAATVQQLMIETVRNGTGTAAAINGVSVAGKTGTAELESRKEKTDEESKENDSDEKTDTQSETEDKKPEEPTTNAWFVSYAPTGRPKIAVAVMLIRAGEGGAVAAPAAREVLLAGL